MERMSELKAISTRNGTTHEIIYVKKHAKWIALFSKQEADQRRAMIFAVIAAAG